MERLEDLIDEMQKFLKTCDAYCDEEAEVNDESKTFKSAVRFLSEKLNKVEKCLVEL